MIFSLGSLLGTGISYLLLLFLIAYICDSGLVPVRMLRHPLIYVLSLGVYVSAWAVFGAVGFAHQMGYNFLAFYFGITALFLLTPVVLLPILKLTRTHHLGSLADLFAYRYRSQWAGTLTTLTMLISCMPILSMQIQAVAVSIGILTHKNLPNTLALWFCIVVSAFTLLFGTRHIRPREKHEGLVVAIAVESIIKLLAMLGLAAYSYWGVLGGHAELIHWLQQHPQHLQLLYAPLKDTPWHTLMLSFLFSAVLMPYMYQIIFTENQQPQHLVKASWGFPLYLLLVALPIPLILWAGLKLANPDIDPEYLTLSVVLASHSKLLSLLTFMAGLSAASGVIIISTLALSSMLLHHVILPIYQPPPEQNIYDWLLKVRRLLILLVIAMSYGLFVALNKQHSLTEMGTITFIGTLQFAPGLVGTLFWPRANRQGYIWGLSIGIALWFLAFLIPFLMGFEIISINTWVLGFTADPKYWQNAGLTITLINTAVFILVSQTTTQTLAEQTASTNCSVDNLRRPQRWELLVHSVAAFQDALSNALGSHSAEREIAQALQDLKMTTKENSPYALRRLRDQLESNLCGLLGPAIAQELLDQHLPYQIHEEPDSVVDIHFMESRLEEYKNRLSGMSGQLDALRRFQRQILYDLPIGVCTLGRDMEILNWNKAIVEYTGISYKEAIGSNIKYLPEPWCSLLTEFVQGDTAHIYKRKIECMGAPRWVSLNRALIGGEGTRLDENQVIVVEDISSIHMLEMQLTHTERLASIGQLAAGVAHEIGNPVTAIACLAQNLKAESDDDEVQLSSNQIIEQTQRISAIVQSLVGFARNDNPGSPRNRETVSIRQCVEEAMSLLRIVPDSRDYHFINECSDESVVSGDRQRLMQVFVNLLSNARDASNVGSDIIVRCQGGGYTLQIEVEDFGCGLPAHIREHLFEPFVTSKEAGKGTGLGLTLVHGIINEHFGKIQLMDKSDYDQGRGVIAQITLPGPTNEAAHLQET